MHRSATVRSGLILVVGGVALGVVAGCDRLQSATSSKSSSPAEPNVSSVATQPRNVLAMVNGAPITVEAYTRRLTAIPEEQRPKELEGKKQLLEELIRVETLVQDAVAMGLERDTQVKQTIEEIRRRILMEEWIQRLWESVVVESNDVEQYYQQYQTGFKEPELIRLRQIVVHTEPEAKNILVHLLEGADFAQVATERSVGPEAGSGGDIGWVIRAADQALSQQLGESKKGLAVFDRLEQAAFALEVGAISGVVKGPDGYYLVKVEERQPAKQKSLSEVWDQIKNGLLISKRQQRLEERMTQLRSRAGVEMREDRLADL